MRLLDPLDAAMMIAETLSSPLHVAAVLIMSPPAGSGPGYVDELYRETLTAMHQVDPRLRLIDGLADGRFAPRSAPGSC